MLLSAADDRSAEKLYDDDGCHSGEGSCSTCCDDECGCSRNDAGRPTVEDEEKCKVG